MNEKPIAVLYEHPEWFEPLFSNFVADAADVVGFDPTAKFVDYILDRAGF